ncbi:helix-turn-helix transcriptional regulator [Weissella cibaria]|uniref:helix-turn-helix transcriptional regulator n=1 Tax=Weissella cibaria TaxID=137591 RepID=UPI0031B6311B
MYENDIQVRIGFLIKGTRKKLGISQRDLADGICSQPMISSIERGDYIPNAILFMQLCGRLNISLDDSFLKEELKMGSRKLGGQIFDLCKKHRYAEMIAFMDQPTVIDDLSSNEDYQTYYYYYGCGVYQLYHDAISAKRYLKMAFMYASHTKKTEPRSEIDMLVMNALGVIEAKLGNMESAYQYLKVSHKAAMLMQDSRENINVVGYQYGYALFLDERYQEALKVLLPAFDRVMEMESYFMLPEYALLIMNCYKQLGNDRVADKYKAQFEVFKDLN